MDSRLTMLMYCLKKKGNGSIISSAPAFSLLSADKKIKSDVAVGLLLVSDVSLVLRKNCILYPV